MKSLWLAPLCVAALGVPSLHGEKAPPPMATEPLELSGKRLELRGVEDTISASDAQRRKIEGEIARLRAERERLNQTLLDAAARLRATEESAAEVEQRLEVLKKSEEAILQSL